MIRPADYYFTPSALTISLNVNTGQQGFTPSETCSVAVAAGAAIKVSNELVTQHNRTINLGYNAQLNYRQFTFTGYNTVFGYKQTLPPQYNYIHAKICVYIRLDASNNGSTGELVFLPYEVDYDGRILDETFIAYDDIATEVHTEDEVIYYSLVNTNNDNTSGLSFYYIHIGTLSEPNAGERQWFEIINSGRLETAKGNNEDGSGTWGKMFRLSPSNVIEVLLPFDKITFNASGSAYIDRIITTVSDNIEAFANWSHEHGLATTASIASYVSARLVQFDNKYFRKDQDDTDPFTATFGDVHVASGLERGEESSGGNLSVDGNVSIGGNASIAGDTDIDGILRVLAQKIVTNLMESDNFSGDWQDVFGSGFQIKKASNGITSLVVDNLFVRMKAIFSELEIRKISYAGGNIIFSHAGSVLERVVPVYEGGYIYQEYIVVMDDDAYYADRGIWNVDGEFDGKGGIIVNNARLEPNPEPRPSDDKIIAYRCYIKADDGTTRTENWWQVDDQARWQTFNVEEGVYQNVENTYGWRLLTKTGEELMDDGLIHQYIDISKADCADLSDAPKAGDQLVQMGNRTNPDRQGFISIEVEGEYAPAFKMYKGVNSYSLEGKRKFCISPFLVDMHYQKLVMETDYDIAQVPMQRSEPWHQGMQCYYYDLVQHNGASWLCTYPESGIGGVLYTTEEPSENAVYWRPYAQKGEQGDPGTSITKISEVTEYVLSTDGETPKSGESWSTTKPSPAQGEYVLTRITITWSDNSTTVMQNAERNPNDGVSGQDIIVDGATVMKYCCNQSNTTHPDEDSSDWKNLDQVTQTQGWWLWSKATTWYRKAGSSAGAHDAGKSVVYNVSYIAEDGDTPEAARGITSITEYYKATNSSTPLPAPTSDAGWDTDPNLSELTDKWDADHIYLWNYEKVTYSKAPLVERTIPQILAIWTQDGEPGRGVDSITNKYKVTNTNVAPAREHEGGTGWSTSPVAPGKGEYLWNYEIIAWTSGTTPTYTDVQQIGYTGTDGASITKSSEVKAYQVSDNGTTTPTGTWQDEAHKPTPSQGQYLWTRTTITWSDASTTVLYSAERNPNDGQPGMSVTITGQSVTYSKQASGNLDPTTLTYGSYPSSLSKGDWLYSKTTVTYSDNTSTNSYGVTYIGTDGDTGRGIQSVVEEYAVNNDPNTAPASSSFSTTFPSWGESNKYVWNREVITYTKGSPASETTTPRIKAIWTKDGKGIDSIVNRYLTNNVSTGITKQNYKSYNDGNEWPTTITPTSASNPYLWNFEVITYTDGTSEMTDPHVIGHFGKDGIDGENAVIASLSTQAVVFTQTLGDSPTITPSSSEVEIVVNDGGTKVTAGVTITVTGTSHINNSSQGTSKGYTINNSTRKITLYAGGINTYQEDGKYYPYDNGYVDINVAYGGTNYPLRLPFYVNVLGKFSRQVEGDVETSIASKHTYYLNSDGTALESEVSAQGTRIFSAEQNVTTLQEEVETEGTGLLSRTSTIEQRVGRISLKVGEGTKSNLIDDPIFVKGDQFTSTGKSSGASFTVNRYYGSPYSSSPWLEDNGGAYGIGISGTASPSAYNAWLTPTSTPRKKLTAGQKYTFSVWVKNNSSGSLSDYLVDRVATIYMYSGTSSSASSQQIDVPLENNTGDVDGWQQFSVTFTCSSPYTYFSWQPRIGVKAGQVGFTLRYAGVKLEIGEVATPMTYSLSPYLKETGIDIASGKITMTADTFECLNNELERTAWLDDMGNFTIRGVYNNLITEINSSNVDKYIIEQNGQFYLDVLLCGTFVVLKALPSGFGTTDSLLLPYYANDNFKTRGYTRYLSSSTSTPRLMTADELRMLAGRKMVIKWNEAIGSSQSYLGHTYYPQVYEGNSSTSSAALIRGSIQRLACGNLHFLSLTSNEVRDFLFNAPRTVFLSLELVKFHVSNTRSDYSYGYIWLGDDDSGAAAKDDINW